MRQNASSPDCTRSLPNGDKAILNSALSGTQILQLVDRVVYSIENRKWRNKVRLSFYGFYGGTVAFLPGSCRHMQVAGRIGKLSRNVFIGQGGGAKMAASDGDVTALTPTPTAPHHTNSHPGMTKLPHAINVFLMP